MRVKIGDAWYEAEPGQPIMVELSEEDRRNIEDMPENMRKYAEFSNDEEGPLSEIEGRQNWMSE